MCLAGISVSVTVALELVLLSSEEEEEDEEESGVAAGGRGGGRAAGLEGRGEDEGMTGSSASSSWATDITLRVREMKGVRERHIFLHCLH